MVLLKTFIQRGNLTESIHEAKCLVKDSRYNILLSTENDQNFVYPRSAIKIFPAVPFVVSEAHKKLGLNKKKIAISRTRRCHATRSSYFGRKGTGNFKELGISTIRLLWTQRNWEFLGNLG